MCLYSWDRYLLAWTFGNSWESTWLTFLFTNVKLFTPGAVEFHVFVYDLKTLATLSIQGQM